MNPLQLLEAIGDVDDTLLQAAHQPLPLKRQFAVHMVTIAASICLIAGASVWGVRQFAAHSRLVSSGNVFHHGTSVSETASATDDTLDQGQEETNDISFSDTIRDMVTESVDLYITGWNTGGFSGAVNMANASFESGMEIQVLMNDSTSCLYSDEQTGTPCSYDMNASNTAVGSYVTVTYSDCIQTDTGIQIVATTVTRYQ